MFENDGGQWFMICRTCIVSANISYLMLLVRVYVGVESSANRPFFQQRFQYDTFKQIYRYDSQMFT